MEYKYVDPVIYNYRVWVDSFDPDELYKTLDSILKKSGYTILNYIEHSFPLHGYTCLWLLAESHLAVHTFPESNRSYIELSGCNETMNECFVSLFQQKFTVIDGQNIHLPM